MEIKKIEKKSSNLYKIILSDNTSLSFYDETIIKYNLLLKKEYEHKTLEEIIKFNNKIDGYYKMINYIKKKLRTEKEIKNKLLEMNYSLDETNYIISKLKKQKYINDKFYIDAYINNQINLTLNGPNKIIFNLNKLGFNDAFLYIEVIDDDIWMNKVKKIIDKVTKRNHNCSKNMLIKKITNNLINLGYDINKYYDVINNINVNNEETIIKKEYNKIKKRYEKKYTGKELDFKIKNYLYKKGFKIDADINDIMD